MDKIIHDLFLKKSVQCINVKKFSDFVFLITVPMFIYTCIVITNVTKD